MEAPPRPSSLRVARNTSSASTDSPSSVSSTAGAAITQTLSSVLNNPSSSYSSTSWSLWWPTAGTVLSSSSSPPDLSLFTPLPTGPTSTISRSDFSNYFNSISDSFARFEDVQSHAARESLLSDDSATGPGEALVACLREVPALFFKEDFMLEEGETFRAACPFSPDPEENVTLQERLGQYLDVVEMHLVREIALRSDSFYEAQGKLQGLDGEIVTACARIRQLKETVKLLDGDVIGPAKQVQELNSTRGNLVALHQKLTVILYVSQALSALKLLVGAADCGGALDVIDDLQRLLDTDELSGLHCFRHLHEQLATSLDSINSILSAELLRAALHDSRAVDSAILFKLKIKSTTVMNGLEDEVKLDDDESLILRDRLLPIIIGLLRIAKLPAALRQYRTTLNVEMKAAIKATVAELLPVLMTRPMESDVVTGERGVDSDGRNLSLASKLRSLSLESFVQLLAAIFKIVQAHLLRAAEVKRVIEWVMGNLDGVMGADSIAATATTTDAEEGGDGEVNSYNPYTILMNAPKSYVFQSRTNDASSPNSSKNFRVDVLRENTEAVFSACDAAQARWAKLLGVRAQLHPKLRLQEFLSIYNITQDFINMTEKIGGRIGYSIRGSLQSQMKSFLDVQHESRMAKIKAVLDQETWVAVDVPEEFQAIVASFSFADIYPNTTDTSSKTVDSAEVDARTSLSPQNGDFNGVTELESNLTRKDDYNHNDRVKSTSQTLLYGGLGYHMVNCGLILLKMISEYIDVSRSLPTLSSEVVHRVLDILKLFNTRTCQLVLGAGAMQVSGLKSITSKHLALASQIISFIYAIMPDIRGVLFLNIPDSRKGVLQAEIDRVAQDYRIHRDEIHTKLVQIMRERLLANLRKLPQIVESWNGPEDNDPQPSQFARSVTKDPSYTDGWYVRDDSGGVLPNHLTVETNIKESCLNAMQEVTYLHRILSQTLLEVDVHEIFRQVVQLFHSHISEAFSNLDVTTPQANNRLCRDVQHILGCIHKLPSDDTTVEIPNFGLLDEFLAERFGARVN